MHNPEVLCCLFTVCYIQERGLKTVLFAPLKVPQIFSKKQTTGKMCACILLGKEGGNSVER